MTTPDLGVGARVDRYLVDAVVRPGPHAVYDVHRIVGSTRLRLYVLHSHDRGLCARALRAARSLLDPIDVIEVGVGVGVVLAADAPATAADVLWTRAAVVPPLMPDPVRPAPPPPPMRAPLPAPEVEPPAPPELPKHVLAHRQTVQGVLIFLIATLLVWGVAQLLKQPRSPWIEPIPTDTL